MSARFPLTILCFSLVAALFGADKAAKTPRVGKAPAKTHAAAPKPPKPATKEPDLWSSKPVVRPEPPAQTLNPIDAFVADMYKQKTVVPVGQADKATLLRRVYLDLIGIPPTPAE